MSKFGDKGGEFRESAALATDSMQHRVETVRSVASKNHPAIFEAALCRYVDIFLSRPSHSRDRGIALNISGTQRMLATRLGVPAMKRSIATLEVFQCVARPVALKKGKKP